MPISRHCAILSLEGLRLRLCNWLRPCPELKSTTCEGTTSFGLQAASFGPGRRSHLWPIRDADNLRLRSPRGLRPWPEPKATVCNSTTTHIKKHTTMPLKGFESPFKTRRASQERAIERSACLSAASCAERAFFEKRRAASYGRFLLVRFLSRERK